MKRIRMVLNSLLFALSPLVSQTAGAVDGVVLIDQNRALAGNVTPGDAPNFPVTISVPGSYRLSGNLTVPNNVDGIVITSNNVTLDLNGFAIVGPVACSGTPVTSCTPGATGSGVRTAGSQLQSNIAVRGGTVRGMGTAGVLLVGGPHLVTDVRVASNGVGIALTGGTLIRNTAANNGTSGMVIGTGTVAHNTVTGNGTDGIQVQDSATVSHNASSGNAGDGILVLRSGSVNHNTALDNGAFGLSLGGVTGFLGNVMTNNTGGCVSGGVSLGQNLCDGIVR
jgi:hypothetical protein